MERWLPFLGGQCLHRFAQRIQRMGGQRIVQGITAHGIGGIAGVGRVVQIGELHPRQNTGGQQQRRGQADDPPKPPPRGRLGRYRHVGRAAHLGKGLFIQSLKLHRSILLIRPAQGLPRTGQPGGHGVLADVQHRRDLPSGHVLIIK